MMKKSLFILSIIFLLSCREEKLPLPVAVGDNLLDMINEARAFNGVKPLVWDTVLESQAFKHSLYQDSIKQMVHSKCLSYAENVAWGYKSNEEVMNGWINSPLHYENIISVGRKKVAVGRSGFYWTMQLQ